MKSILVANWKMNPTTFREAKKLLEATKKAADAARHVSIIVAPPSLYLRELRGLYRGRKILFAAQNAHFDESGAYTGEISIAQIKESGFSNVLIGHAERRALGETNEDTGKKIVAALSLGMTPIFCIGEKERSQSGEYLKSIRDQIRAGFADVPSTKIPKVLVAYEPVWAIGGDTAMTPRDMHEMAIFIRKTIVDLYGQSGMTVKILYGGAIDENNAPEMVRDGDVAGLLVGRASADPKRITALIQSIESA